MLLTRLATVVAVLAAFDLLYFGSMPGLAFVEGLFLFPMALLSVVILAVCTIVSLVGRKYTKRTVMVIAGEMCAILSLIALSSGNALVASRVALSEPWLRPYAKSLQASQVGDKREHWVGLFPVRSAVALPGGASLSTGSDGLLGDAGLMFLPGGTGGTRLQAAEHLYGPWWRYRESDD
jgi:hypothetical protein